MKHDESGEPTAQPYISGEIWRMNRPATGSGLQPGALRFALTAGVVLPLVMLALELSTRLFTEMVFDPFPTAGHIAVFLVIPVGNAVVLWGMRRASSRWHLWMVALNGLALGVALWYALQFLPMSLLAMPAMFIVFFFPPLIVFVVCGIAPPLACISAFICRTGMATGARKTGASLAGFWLGLGCAALFLIALEIPGALTESFMRHAAAADPATSRQAIARLRKWGDTEVILRRCYDRPRTGAGLLSLLMSGADNVDTEHARAIYYRVTGEPFNTEPAPVNLNRGRGLFRGGDLDAGQGGDEVAGKVEGLSLTSSRLDGSVDADAALGYLEWTIVFTNVSAVQREARMQVAPPPGACVSRLTLWVNGEEREAAFSARGRVREAYRKVAVIQQRDPVLVTTCGSDRVLVQCFPVPPDGGTMKVRLGITAPLVLDELTSGTLALPRIVEQNFETAESLGHSIWLEAKTSVSSELPGLRVERSGASAYAVRGSVPERAFAGAPAVLRFQRNPDITEAWTPDDFGSRRSVICQTIAPVSGAAPRRVVVVVDGSESMHDSLPAIGSTLDSLPRGSEFAVLAAGDDVQVLAPLQAVTPEACARTAEELRAYRCTGGADNVPALAQAWDLARERPGGAILWIHGPQPLLLDVIGELQQRWERDPDGPRLYALEAVAGDNAPLRELDKIYAVRNVARLGTLDADLGRFLSSWNDQHLQVTRKRVDAASGNGKETSKHLARLWAHSQAMAFYAQHTPKQTEMAIAVARQYQIVTPVTGAVVLETQQQYRDAGLEPVSAGTVPSVPEPEFWLLLAVGFVMLAWFWWKRRAACVVR
ncbi:MAG: VIT domain-containing protein [Armatimonadota bacterium]